MGFKNAHLLAFLLFYLNLLVDLSKGEYCPFKLGRTFKSKEKCTNMGHCVYNVFDTRTGQCVGANNHCEPKWMGPGCQYQNLAVNPENYDLVYDGKMTTHRSIQKATVNLNGEYNLSVVNIYTVYSTPVHIKIEDDQKAVVYDGFLRQESTSLHLNRSTISTHLYIWFSANTDIREIQVFGGRNVALWQRTSQVGRDEDPAGLDLSGGAVDGWDDSVDFVPISCTDIYSLKKSPFWRVSLDGFYALKYIVVSFANANHLNPDDFTLNVRTSNGAELSIYRYMKPHSPSSRKAVSKIIIDSSHMPSSLVNEVIIRGESQTNILTLCEVSVFDCYILNNIIQACSPTSTGDNCRSFCPEHCHPSEKCLTGNITCSRCQSGWTGPSCEQAVMCDQPSPTSPALVMEPNLTSYTYNSTIKFRCGDGLYLEGPNTLVCRDSASLLAAWPQCSAVDQHSGESSTSYALEVGLIARLICLILCLVCIAMTFRSKRKIRIILRNPISKMNCFEIDLGHQSTASTEEEKENGSDFDN